MALGTYIKASAEEIQICDIIHFVLSRFVLFLSFFTHRVMLVRLALSSGYEPGMRH